MCKPNTNSYMEYVILDCFGIKELSLKGQFRNKRMFLWSKNKGKIQGTKKITIFSSCLWWGYCKNKQKCIADVKLYTLILLVVWWDEWIVCAMKYKPTFDISNVHMSSGIREFCCKLCNYKGVTQSDLNRHMKSQIHMLKSRNACKYCGEGFVTTKNLEKHLDGNCIVKMQKLNGGLDIPLQERVA